MFEIVPEIHYGFPEYELPHEKTIRKRIVASNKKSIQKIPENVFYRKSYGRQK
jgi:hypothetical protein